jgi:hypothetical protein
VTAESAWAAPRHHTSTAPAAVASAPAANVGTVRQDSRRPSASPRSVLDRFLPALSRSAEFFVLRIGIAAALAASKDERGRRAALRGLVGVVIFLISPMTTASWGSAP